MLNTCSKQTFSTKRAKKDVEENDLRQLMYSNYSCSKDFHRIFIKLCK